MRTLHMMLAAVAVAAVLAAPGWAQDEMALDEGARRPRRGRR